MIGSSLLGRALPALLALLLALPARASTRVQFVAAPGAESVAQALGLHADEDRDSVTSDLGRDWDGVTEVRVAPAEDAFRRQLPPGVQVPEWAQGVAFPELNLVVMKAPPGDLSARATLRHELSHIAVGRLTHDSVPRWFLEGLATVRAGDSWSRKGPSLVRADLTDGLFSFDSLTRGFPAGPTDAQVAYAQSADFVQFLVDRSGEASLQEVLRQVVAGSSFDDAFTRVLGARPRALEAEWRRSLARWEMLARMLTNGELWWGLVVLLALVAAWKVRVRRNARLRLLDLEEQAESRQRLAALRALSADGVPQEGANDERLWDEEQWADGQPEEPQELQDGASEERLIEETARLADEQLPDDPALEAAFGAAAEHLDDPADEPVDGPMDEPFDPADALFEDDAPEHFVRRRAPISQPKKPTLH